MGPTASRQRCPGCTPWLQLLSLCGAALCTTGSGTVLKPTRPFMGFSTWNTFGQNIDEHSMQETAQAMIDRGLVGLGYRYLNLDDGWAAEQRNASGQMSGHPSKFPSGMRALADFLHVRDMKFGLYTARNTRTCQGKMPGSLGHETVDAATFAAMGADFVKNDDCGVIYAHAVKDYGAMEAAIAAADRPMLHNVKAPDLPPSHSVQVCQFRRVGKDLRNSWQNLVRVLDTGTDPAFAALAGPTNGFFNDFDMLEVGATNVMPGVAGMTYREQQAHFSLWAALKSPLVLGNDPRSITAATLAIVSNTEVIAVNQDELGAQVQKISWACPAASGQPAGGTKALLEPCQPGNKQQLWTIDGPSRRIRHADNNTDVCLGLYKCATRWPWWIETQPCASTVPPAKAACAAASAHTVSISGAGTAAANGEYKRSGGGETFVKADGKSTLYAYRGAWHIGVPGKTVYYASAPDTAGPPVGGAAGWSVGSGGGAPVPSLVKCDVGVAGDRGGGCSASSQQDFSVNGSTIAWNGRGGQCWGSPGAGCCVSTEGSNVELDTCGWAMNQSQQTWQVKPAEGASDDTVQIVSRHNGYCLTKCSQLQVYAGPLAGHGHGASGAATATVILFNRSPAAASMRVSFADLTAAFHFKAGSTGVQVRDIVNHKSLGVSHAKFETLVPPHAAVHVNLTPLR